MNFVEEPLVFSKTDRLHRAIISYLPAQEREDNYLPFGERSEFSKRKEYDLVIKELKHKMFIEYDECPAGKSWEDIRDLYILKLQNEREQRIRNAGEKYIPFRMKEYLITSNGVFTYRFMLEGHSFSFPLLGYRVGSNKPNEYPIKSYFLFDVHKKDKDYKENVINFLRQNGFTITGRERNKTYVKMLMSF